MNIPKRNTRSTSQSSTPESSLSTIRVESDVQENVEATQSTSSSEITRDYRKLIIMLLTGNLTKENECVNNFVKYLIY